MYVPLGGTGEIGMNLNMYGTDGQWLMIDCGMMMDRGASTDEVIVPDASFAVAHKDDLAGIVLTHAHMDHIGALPGFGRRSSARFTRPRTRRRSSCVN